MKVKLIQKTQNLLDTIYTGATTCYNAGSPIDKWFDVCNISTDKKIKLVNSCITSGHTSVLEHSQFTFAIEGVSRALLAQITRHRVGMSFSVQSQRYVEIKEDFNELIDLRDKELKTTNDEIYLIEICQKYFIDVTSNNYKNYLDCLINYLYEVQVNKNKPEDARMLLPNATKTNIVLTCNLRSLIHLCEERLCMRAQKEIRNLVKEMVKLVVKDEEWLKPYLVPKCERIGYCPESKPCGRKPSLPVLLGQEYNKGYEDARYDGI